MARGDDLPRYLRRRKMDSERAKNLLLNSFKLVEGGTLYGARDTFEPIASNDIISRADLLPLDHLSEREKEREEIHTLIIYSYRNKSRPRNNESHALRRIPIDSVTRRNAISTKKPQIVDDL